MSLSKLILGTASVMVLMACAPAAQQSAEKTHNHDHASSHASSNAATHETAKNLEDTMHRATVKPGAAVSLKSVLPKAMTSGSFQTVRLELTEQYQDGIMTVSVKPSDGLSLFGGSDSETFNMANSGPHIWDVDVQADNNGVYFLNVFAKADGQPRSFSVRLNIGVTGAEAKKMFNDAMPAEGELADDVDGNKIRVLDARETIQ